MDRREFLKFTGIGVVSAFSFGKLTIPKKVEAKEPEFIKTSSDFTWIHSVSPDLKSHIDMEKVLKRTA